MIYHNLLIKKIKRQILSINTEIENSFNKIRYFKKNYKKIIFNKDNRVFFVSATLILAIVVYLLIPTSYNKTLIETELKNHILKKYNIEVRFNENIKYGLLPKPHFISRNLSIFNNKKEVGVIDDFRAYIQISKFFRINKIFIKDLVLKKGAFYFQKRDFSFFKKLLETEPNEKKIIIKNSNIFFKDKNDEVIFINKIFNSKIYYDSKNLKNILKSKNEIFNISYNLEIKNDKFEKNFLTKFDSNKIRLNLENSFNYDKENKNGLLNILFINKNTSLKYRLKENKITFKSTNVKEPYNGLVEIKPFYFDANFSYNGLNLKNFLKQDSLITNLIRSEIFNNKNLNGNIKLKLKNITNINELNNLFLNIEITEGKVNFSNSNVNWKENLIINLSESYLNYDDSQINLEGKINLSFIDIDNFYRSFQIKKIYRKKIEKIEMYFLYDFNRNKVTLSNLKIDGNSNLNIEEYVENFNSIDNDIFNKVRFKNFVSNFFAAYAG
tara:strand:+ start:2100 stop:3590 length:1491 start_codon:yes stop_codon:yes gene_type:complete